jgi:hypothetical protein
LLWVRIFPLYGFLPGANPTTFTAEVYTATTPALCGCSRIECFSK